MMLSQKILVCAATAFLWGVAGTPESGDERKREEHREQREAAEFARQREIAQARETDHSAEVKAYLQEMLRSREEEAQFAGTPQKIEAAIRDLMRARRQLQMRELDIETELQRQEIAGELDSVRALQRELIEIRAQRERHELEIESRQEDFNHTVERRDIRRMRERLDYVSNWRSVAFDPQEAVMMATQAVVETGLASDDPHQAAETLEDLLDEIRDLGSRTAIRFALRDLYGELNRLGKAGEHMKQVVRENARALEGERHDEPQ